MNPIERAKQYIENHRPYAISLIRDQRPKFSQSEDLLLNADSPHKEVDTMFSKKDNKTVEAPEPTATTDKVQELQQAIDAKDAELNQLRQAMDELKPKVDSFESYESQLSQAIDKFETAQHDAQAHAERLERLEKSNQKLMQAIEKSGAVIVGRGKITEGQDGQIDQAFLNYLTYGKDAQTHAQFHQASYVVGTDANGGYLVPELWMNQIVQKREEGSRVRAAGAESMAINGFTDLHWPVETEGSDMVYGAETPGTTTDVGSTFSEVVFNPWYAKGKIAISENLNEDALVMMQQNIRSRLTKKVIKLENASFTTGTGTNQPRGVTVAATDSGVSGSATAFTAVQIIQLLNSVDYLYWVNGRLMLSQAMVSQLDQERDLSGGASTGQLMWQPDLSGSVSPRFRGFPVVINNSMPSTTGTRAAVFGDFGFYKIIDYKRPTIERFDHTKLDSSLITYRVAVRHDGDLVDANALKYASLA